MPRVSSVSWSPQDLFGLHSWIAICSWLKPAPSGQCGADCNLGPSFGSKRMPPPLTDMEGLRDALNEDFQALLLNAFGTQEHRLRVLVKEAMTASQGHIMPPELVKTQLGPVLSETAPHYCPGTAKVRSL